MARRYLTNYSFNFYLLNRINIFIVITSNRLTVNKIRGGRPEDYLNRFPRWSLFRIHIVLVDRRSTWFFLPTDIIHFCILINRPYQSYLNVTTMTYHSSYVKTFLISFAPARTSSDVGFNSKCTFSMTYSTFVLIRRRVKKDRDKKRKKKTRKKK